MNLKCIKHIALISLPVIDLTFVLNAYRKQKFYRIDLDKSLDGGRQTTVDVEVAFSHTLQPYPASIAQSEKQLMRFLGNLYYYSPYPTTSQTTIVNCASSNIESYTKTNPVKVSDSSITYGPFEDKAAFSEVKIIDHVHENIPSFEHLHQVLRNLR